MQAMILITSFCLVFVLFSLTGLIRILFKAFSHLFHCSIVQVSCHTCRGKSQYMQCSTNTACGCFQKAAVNESDICGFLWLTCSQLVSCEPSKNVCYQPGHVCVRHPRCHVHPICYPLAMTKKICPPISTPILPPRPGDGICARATWAQNATTVADGNDQGSALNQLSAAAGFFVDVNQTIYVADTWNHRVVKWDRDALIGQLMAGGQGYGNNSNQLNRPQDVVVDKDGTLYVIDYLNRRIQRWSRGAQSGQTVIKDISGAGIVEDDQGSFYVSDWISYKVRKWRVGETIAQVIISTMSYPDKLFVDRNRSVYLTDANNHRVIRVDEGSTQISVVAGGSEVDDEVQLSLPTSVIVDELGTVYVTDADQHRIIRWPRGATSGTIIAGGRGKGSQSDQLESPQDLSFDLDGNLYVLDHANQRVQKFTIDKSLC